MSQHNETIYILTNEAMPGYIKIGYTYGSLEDRLRQLDTTSMPLPFEVYYACEVEDAKEDERWMHEILGDKRVRDRREFFKMDPERAVIALQRIQLREIETYTSIATPTQQKEIAQKKKIRSRFDFDKYGIPVGAEIYFSRDENVNARVLSKNRIELNGLEVSLSQSAEQILGFGPVAGTLYWMYEGETLDERRRRMDNENNG